MSDYMMRCMVLEVENARLNDTLQALQKEVDILEIRARRDHRDAERLGEMICELKYGQ